MSKTSNAAARGVSKDKEVTHIAPVDVASVALFLIGSAKGVDVFATQEAHGETYNYLLPPSVRWRTGKDENPQYPILF
jgi:hypothetical protein